MVYRMEFYVDGGCRGNGFADSVAAAAVILQSKAERYSCWTRILDTYPVPTSQRAELTAVIMALEQALEKSDGLRFNPRLAVKIYSDSTYAVNCMNIWLYKWLVNGWLTARGRPVVNRDLIQRASDLEDELRQLGTVHFEWIPRVENELADRWCNAAMDGQQQPDF